MTTFKLTKVDSRLSSLHTSVQASLGMSLGSGVFARAYDHPSDPTRIVKVSLSRGQCGAKDGESDGWLSWIRACNRFPSRYAPRVLTVKMYVSVHERGILIVADMERLTAWQDVTDEDTMAGKLDCDAIHTDASSPLSTFRIKNQYRKLMKSGTNPDIRNIAAALHQVRDVDDCGDDLHAFNWMVRKAPDGGYEPVITDPVV